MNAFVDIFDSFWLFVSIHGKQSTDCKMPLETRLTMNANTLSSGDVSLVTVETDLYRS